MIKRVIFLGVPVLAGVAWLASAPPSYHEPAPPRVIGEPPPELARADVGDVIRQHGVSIADALPGHDEVLPLPGTDAVLISGRDEWIWKVNVRTNTAEQFAFSPVSPTGAHLIPGESDAVYYCMARLDYHQYTQGPGLYRLDLESREFTPIVTRVPITGTLRPDGLEVPNHKAPDEDLVHATPLNNTPHAALTASNSRPMQFCNDLDVSSDGRFVFMTEPFSNPKASSGLGAMPDGITLARNGRVWRYDTQTTEVGLVLENNVFADGILVEEDGSGRVTSLLIAETVNFRIGRAWLTGPKAGSYDRLWDDLPGLPDGMDRDDSGRIWVGLIKDRTRLMTWMHANPWVKPLVLRIPAERLPRTLGTAILALSADASEVLAFSHHDGSRVVDISVVAPAGDKLFLPSFYQHNIGLHYVPIDAVLNPTTAQ